MNFHHTAPSRFATTGEPKFTMIASFARGHRPDRSINRAGTPARSVGSARMCRTFRGVAADVAIGRVAYAPQGNRELLLSGGLPTACSATVGGGRTREVTEKRHRKPGGRCAEKHRRWRDQETRLVERQEIRVFSGNPGVFPLAILPRQSLIIPSVQSRKPTYFPLISPQGGSSTMAKAATAAKKVSVEVRGHQQHRRGHWPDEKAGGQCARSAL